MPTINIASLETYSNTYSEHKIKPSNPYSNSNSKSKSGQQHDPDSSSHNNSSSSLVINPNFNSNSNSKSAAAAEASTAAAAPPPPPIYLMRSPSLYATPSPHQQLGHHAAPVWDSSPPSPSPYLTNSKRRAGGGTTTNTNADAILRLPPPSLHQMNQNQSDEVIVDDHQGQGDGDGDGDGDPLLLAIAKAKAKAKAKADALVYDDDDAYDLEEDDDFFESRDSMSIASSSSEAEDRPTLPRPRHRHYPFGSAHQSSSISNQSLTQSDYYDAADDFFSDGSASNSSPSFSTNINKELKALRLSLIEESERRKKAEVDLLYIHIQWERIAAYLSQVGFSFPAIQHSGNEQLDLDPAEICQEIIVTRFVSEAIERALARAETEVITEAIIDSKNHEISRLRDRLQYYEAMNREMSQRNQEAVEFTRRQRLKRETKWRLIWGCVGLSVTFGASMLAYSYLPNSGKHSLPTFSPDASAPSTSNFRRN